MRCGKHYLSQHEDWIGQTKAVKRHKKLTLAMIDRLIASIDRYAQRHTYIHLFGIPDVAPWAVKAAKRDRSWPQRLSRRVYNILPWQPMRFVWWCFMATTFRRLH